jgi:pyruvate ferredoxin oxidoreductase gamma subunit
VLVVNTKKTPEQISEEFSITWSLATVDATKIAQELLGVPIVNTSMIGALLKATSVVKLESLFEPLRRRFGRLAERNIEAMKRAHEETLVRSKSN